MNILLAIDDSDASHKALLKAITLCQSRESECRITLFHVIPDADSQTDCSIQAPCTVTMQKQAEALLQAAGDQLWAAGIDFDTLMAIGEPVQEILLLAEAADFDMIIMGSHGGNQQVLLEAACPVMVA